MSNISKKMIVRAIISVIVLSSSVFLSASVSEASNYSEQLVPKSTAQPDSLLLNITPPEDTLYQNESQAFNLVISNPPTSDERYSGFLYVGYEIHDNPPTITVADRPANVRYQDIVGRYLEFNLTPGGKRIFPIIIHRNSGAGDYTLNATAIYFEEHSLTKKSSVALISIEPTECLLVCQTQRLADDVVLLIESNWEWIISVLSLLVAIASLLAPNRVRKFVGLSERPDTESTNE